MENCFISKRIHCVFSQFYFPCQRKKPINVPFKRKCHNGVEKLLIGFDAFSSFPEIMPK